MEKTKQSARTRFQRFGSGVFVCRMCSRSTRDTGDNGNVRLCPQCYELAGLINEALDTNRDDPYQSEIHGYQDKLRAEIQAKGGILGKHTACYCAGCANLESE